MARMDNKELEMYFYETASPKERSEMRREQYEEDDWDTWDSWDEEDFQ